MEKAKERYNKLQKKYKLPDYDYIDFEFEIFLLEDEKYLLRVVKDKITQKIDDYVKILEDILNPDSSSYSSIYETRSLSDEDKMKILKVHQNMMILVRKALLVSIDNKEEDIAEFINDVYKKWETFKPTLRKVVNDIIKEWKRETFEDKTVIEYLG